MEIRTVDDFIPQLKEKYPELSETQLKQIAVHGLREIINVVTKSCDVCIKGDNDSKFVWNTGKIFGRNRKLEFKRYWHSKMIKKIRLMYFWGGKQWDGKYYFGLTNADYDKWKENKNRRQKYDFGEVVLYKCLDEAMLYMKFDRFFQIEWPQEEGYRIVVDNLVTNKAEYIYKIDKKNRLTIPASINSPKPKYKTWYQLKK